LLIVEVQLCTFIIALISPLIWSLPVYHENYVMKCTVESLSSYVCCLSCLVGLILFVGFFSFGYHD